MSRLTAKVRFLFPHRLRALDLQSTCICWLRRALLRQSLGIGGGGRGTGGAPSLLSRSL